MKVSRKNAVTLFKAMDFKTADKWSVARLQTKINKLPDLCEGVKLKQNLQSKLDEICKVLNKGGTVTVFDSADKAGDKARDKDVKDAGKREATRKTEAKKKKKSKAKSEVKKEAKKEKDKSSAKKAVKADKKTSGKDTLGFRLGSQAAVINSHMSKKSITLKDLAKKSKLKEGRVRQHVRWLIFNELAKETKNGYAL